MNHLYSPHLTPTDNNYKICTKYKILTYRNRKTSRADKPEESLLLKNCNQEEEEIGSLIIILPENVPNTPVEGNGKQEGTFQVQDTEGRAQGKV